MRMGKEVAWLIGREVVGGREGVDGFIGTYFITHDTYGFHLLGKGSYDNACASLFRTGVLSGGEKEERIPWSGVSGMLVISKAG